jgi:CRP-like cAMP-binding protein
MLLWMNELPDTPILAHLHADEINILAGHGRYYDYSSGAAIVVEGADQDHLFVLCSGRAKVLQKNVAPAVTAWIEVGDSFGEINLFDLDDTGASASVVAEGDCRIWAIDRACLNSFMEGHDSATSRLLLGLVTALSKRIRASNKVVKDMVSGW